MMSGRFTLPLGYSPEMECRILELPFTQKRISMFILLPDETDGLASLERKITAENVKMLFTTLEVIIVLLGVYFGDRVTWYSPFQGRRGQRADTEVSDQDRGAHHRGAATPRRHRHLRPLEIRPPPPGTELKPPPLLSRAQVSSKVMLEFWKNYSSSHRLTVCVWVIHDHSFVTRSHLLLLSGQ